MDDPSAYDPRPSPGDEPDDTGGDDDAGEDAGVQPDELPARPAPGSPPQVPPDPEAVPLPGESRERRGTVGALSIMRLERIRIDLVAIGRITGPGVRAELEEMADGLAHIIGRLRGRREDDVLPPEARHPANVS